MNHTSCSTQDSVSFSKYQMLEMKAIAKQKNTNFNHLYLAILNSSTITSMVAMYMNVPADMDSKMLVTNNPCDERTQPKP